MKGEEKSSLFLSMYNKFMLVIFDLDGVLVEAKEIHFQSLNKALSNISEKYMISWDEHIKTYDGLKTLDKLLLLTKNKNFPHDELLFNKVFEDKQFYTSEALAELPKNNSLIELFIKIKSNGHKIACCSNSIQKTIDICLLNLGIKDYFDLILSNEDVRFSKPHPEIYWKAMSHFGLFPYETIIVEDSPVGLRAAYNSGAKVIRVASPKDLNLKMLESQMYEQEKSTKWIDKKMNVVIPMAGNGSRFLSAGYTFPKPLIEVNGKPMIQTVVDNLAIDANFIFIVQKEHRNKYNLDSMLSLISPGCKIVEVDSVTEGAACTVLLAKEFIDNDNPLVIANSDQYVEWNSLDFFYKMNEQNLDAGIVTFKSTHPKWSYARLDENEYVAEVAEKNPISNVATVGIYWWKKGSDYVKFAEQMIQKNIRVNNEFYVCPVFNEAILDNFKIKTFDVPKMWGLGTPEDLDYFIKKFKK